MRRPLEGLHRAESRRPHLQQRVRGFLGPVLKVQMVFLVLRVPFHEERRVVDS